MCVQLSLSLHFYFTLFALLNSCNRNDASWCHTMLVKQSTSFSRKHWTSSDLCPPNSPVDDRICGLMEEREYIVQTAVRDTSRCDQRLEAAPHWHMGKHVTKCHWQSSWSGQWRKRLYARLKAKWHHFEHLLNWNWLFSELTHYTTGSFQRHQQSTEENTLFRVISIPAKRK